MICTIICNYVSFRVIYGEEMLLVQRGASSCDRAPLQRREATVAGKDGKDNKG